MSRVFVIMGNDFPEAVFADEAEANAFVAQKSQEDLGRVREALANGQYAARIYWRPYECDLIGQVQP